MRSHSAGVDKSHAGCVPGHGFCGNGDYDFSCWKYLKRMNGVIGTHGTCGLGREENQVDDSGPKHHDSVMTTCKKSARIIIAVTANTTECLEASPTL